MTSHDFATRVTLARQMIARGVGPLPGHTIDQIQAAGAEVRGIHDRIGAVLPILEPERRWRQRVDAEPSETTRAHLLAALLGCTTVCPRPLAEGDKTLCQEHRAASDALPAEWAARQLATHSEGEAAA